MWKWIRWQRQRWTCYRVQYRNVAWCSIYECLFELSSTTNILHCHLVQNKNTSPRILEMYVSPVCFDRDMFRSKYARRVHPWTFSMLCRWRHWGRGMHLLPLQRHSRETSLSTWLPMPDLQYKFLISSIRVRLRAGSRVCGEMGEWNFVTGENGINPEKNLPQNTHGVTETWTRNPSLW